MKNIVSICAVLALAACASTPVATTASNDTDGRICERVSPTGSSISKTQCTTAEERAQQRQAVEEVRGSMQRARGTSTTSPGG